MKNFKD